MIVLQAVMDVVETYLELFKDGCPDSFRPMMCPNCQEHLMCTGMGITNGAWESLQSTSQAGMHAKCKWGSSRLFLLKIKQEMDG